MPQANVAMNVRRIDTTTCMITIQGEISAFAERALLEAYTEASTPTTHAIILNCTALEYLNSSGIGLLVAWLIRSKQKRQHLLACGLSEHYRHIFAITRLNEVLGVYNTEAQALAAAHGI